MKDIKDKPDFEAIAIELVGEGCKPGEHEHDCACSFVEDGMEKIWNDHYLPALKRIEELEKLLSDIENKDRNSSTF